MVKYIEASSKDDYNSVKNLDIRSKINKNKKICTFGNNMYVNN